MSDATTLISCALYIIVPASIAGVAIYTANRMRRAAKAEIANDECVSCGSRELTSLGPDAYRCAACGYEGGAGLVRLQQDAQQRAIEAMSPEERRRSGIKDLLEARDYLRFALDAFETVSALSVTDLVGVGGSDRGQAKQRKLVYAMGEAERAQRFIRTAALKLGDQVRAEQIDLDFGSAAFGLDTAFDNIAADLMVHDAILKARAQAQQMLSAVEHALHTLGAPSATPGA